MCKQPPSVVTRRLGHEKFNARLIDKEAEIGTLFITRNEVAPILKLILETLHEANKEMQENMAAEVLMNNNNINLVLQHLREINTQDTHTGMKHVLLDYNQDIQTDRVQDIHEEQ